MSATEEPHPRFADRAAFRAWADQQPGRRWEWDGGQVVAMAPERLGHALVRARAWAALDRAIRDAGLACQAFPDGVTVEVDPYTDYQPDAVVVCGERAVLSGVVARNPIIVVEVLSPSTGYRDIGVKLAGYFRIPTVQHYLLLAADRRSVVHHRRIDGAGLATSVHVDGVVTLAPPGLRIAVADLYLGVDVVETPG